jgi:hypothetical protein
MSRIHFQVDQKSYTGSITTLELEREFSYFIDLGESLQFTISLDENGDWKSTNPFIEAAIIRSVGDFIERMEDFKDVISVLNILKN